MFKNLSTSTKLYTLCTAFVVAVGVPVYVLIAEKRVAIDFARKELVGSRYLAAVREVYAATTALSSGDAPIARAAAPGIDVLESLARAEAEAGTEIETRKLGRALADALRKLWAHQTEAVGRGQLVLDALGKAQALAARIGDDSKLALDPELDSYYLQSIVVHLMPTLVGRLTRVQQALETVVESGSPSSSSSPGDVHLPVPASLLQSTMREIESGMEAAYRGNPDGNLKRSLGGGIATMISSMNSYLDVLKVTAAGVDARDAVPYHRSHSVALGNLFEAWAVAQSELDRLLQRRIDVLSGRLWLDLGLIGVLAGLSFCLAALTHRHVVRPLRKLEAIASAVRETKDYGLRAEYTSRDEIGRVTAAFNDMLSELAAAHARESAERAEFARVTRVTAMGEMAASIAHEVNQPLAAIVSSGHAGLRWLDHETPDVDKVRTILQRVVRDGLRASEMVGSVRAMFKKDVRERSPLDVRSFIAEVVAPLRGELQREQISLEVDAVKGLANVLADRVQLQQVLVNLIANAIDAMRSVRDRPRQLLLGASVVESGVVLITVADTGSGIDARVRDRVFDPFVTTKASGMGLGLPICRSIVEAHGGRVWASAGSPHGTVFRVMLPVRDAGGA